MGESIELRCGGGGGKIIYDVRPQILPVIKIFLIVTVWNVLREFDGGSLSAFLLLALLAAALSSYRFQFNINGDYLVYQVFILFNVPIWKKEIYPDQIKQLKFNEVWYGFKRAAVIKLNKGMNIRLSILEQREGYDHLLEFARKHNLEVYKTKDYLWLEERNR